MMMKQSTEDEINDWAVNRYASTAAPSLTAAASPAPAAAPASSGMLSASTATPTAIAAPAPQAAASPASSASTWAAAAAPASSSSSSTAPAVSTPTSSSSTMVAAKALAPNIDVNNWYRNELGRDGDAAGVAYWQQQLANGADPQALYKEFAKGATANAETVKPVDWASANTYTGPVSANSNSIADEWGRNVLGRPLSSAEQSAWDAKLAGVTNPAQGQAVYDDFINSYGSAAKPGITQSQASQIVPAAPTTPGATQAPTGANAAQIAKADLTARTIDKPTETVQGQIGNVLAENSPVLQQARADAMRSANDRGMLNSAMAASGGEDAVIRAATGIATTDAGAYNNAANYNAAAQNQATMWNADQVGQMQRLTMQQNADAAARAQQMQIAQMQDSTTRYNAEMSANTAKYNTDASYRQQMDSQKQSLANNIIANMDLSPDRKAAMLESIGMGTSAKTNPDGSTSPGTGLAGAVYVIGSTTADLQYNPANPAKTAVNTMMGALG